MNHSIVYLLLLVAIAFGAVADLKTEDEAVAFIDQEENGNEENVKLLIVKCIENSWWKAGEKTILVAYHNKLDVADEFKKAVSKQRASIQKLQNLINKNKEDYSVIAPAFQWAQGNIDLKMNIKLAHKWDTPATLGCTVESVKFEEQRVYFEAKCPSSKKKFVLNLNLQKRISPEFCSWNEAAVGRIVLNMKKYEAGLWDNIIVKLKKMPKNIHTWWSMQDQLEKQDREAKEAEDKRLDEQRREAERIYWENKKKEEAEAKAEAEAEGKTGETPEENSKPVEATEESAKPTETTEQVEEKVPSKENEVELLCVCSYYVHRNRFKNTENDLNEESIK